MRPVGPEVLTFVEQAIRHLGGIPLNKMMQEALDMGDEAHNRNNALASIVRVTVLSSVR